MATIPDLKAFFALLSADELKRSNDVSVGSKASLPRHRESRREEGAKRATDDLLLADQIAAYRDLFGR